MDDNQLKTQTSNVKTDEDQIADEQNLPTEKVVETPVEEAKTSHSELPNDKNSEPTNNISEPTDSPETSTPIPAPDNSGARWYVVHTYSGHENKVAAGLKQKIGSEHLEDKIVEVLFPTQE